MPVTNYVIPLDAIVYDAVYTPPYNPLDPCDSITLTGTYDDTNPLNCLAAIYYNDDLDQLCLADCETRGDAKLHIVGTIEFDWGAFATPGGGELSNSMGVYIGGVRAERASAAWNIPKPAGYFSGPFTHSFDTQFSLSGYSFQATHCGASSPSTWYLTLAVAFPGSFSGPTPGHSRLELTTVEILIPINDDDCGGPPGDGPDDVAGLHSDVYRGVIVSAWCTQPAGGTKDLMIGIQRGALKNIGDGSGETAGWTVYAYQTIEESSPIGIAFLPNGRLYLTYTVSGVEKYVTSDVFGEEGSWSSEQDATPAVAAIKNAVRAQGQTARVWTE